MSGKPMTAITRRVAIVGLLVILADQATKTLARLWLPACMHAGRPACLPVGRGPVGFLRIGNGGSALGFAQGEPIWTLLALAGCVLTISYFPHRPSALLGAAVGLQLGGAVSNLADRLVAGTATDFLVAGPIVLNLADVALLAGTVIAVSVLMSEPNDQPHRRFREEVRPR